MNSRMHMNFSFPCLTGFMRRWKRISANPIVKVIQFLKLVSKWKHQDQELRKCILLFYFN